MRFLRQNQKRQQPRPSPGSERSEPAHPEDFGKKTSPVRERLTREVKDMPPKERLSKKDRERAQIAPKRP